MAGRIGERERIIADIGVAVPALRAERTFRDRIRGREPRQQRIVDSAVHVHEPDRVEFFVSGEAATGLAADAACNVVGTVRIAALAPGVIGQPLHHHAEFIRDDRDRAEVIGVEVARGQRLGGDLKRSHADLGISDREIFGPLRRSRAGIADFRQHAEACDIERRPLRGHLLEALMLGVVDEADRTCALRDARGLIVGRIGNGAAKPRGLVAVRVIGEGGAERPAAGARHRVRQWRTRRRVAVIADVGFREDVADRAVGEGLDQRRRAQAHRRRRQAVETSSEPRPVEPVG